MDYIHLSKRKLSKIITTQEEIIANQDKQIEIQAALIQNQNKNYSFFTSPNASFISFPCQSKAASRFLGSASLMISWVMRRIK